MYRLYCLLQAAYAVLRIALAGLSDQIARHNIEEFGNFEFFLSDLYRQHHP